MIDQAELHRRVYSKRLEDRKDPARLFEGAFFSELPDKSQGWQDLHRLIQDEDSYVQKCATDALASSFLHVPDKSQAWQDLHRLTEDENINVRWRVADALGSSFSHFLDKDLA